MLVNEAEERHRSDATFLSGGGDMGARMRAMDWSATPLGPVEGWSEALRSATSIMLNSRFPIALYWGEELALLYNDAWSPIPGGKHPWALGQPGRAVWPEIWDTIGPLYERVMRTGVGVWQEDELLPMRRHGYVEECYFNFTFSPVRGEGGRIEGIFNAVVETTDRVLSERRLRTLSRMGERADASLSVDEACRWVATRLAENRADVPFVLVYLREGEQARLVAATGIAPDEPAAPAILPLDGASPWPLAAAEAEGCALAIPAPAHLPLPRGLWPEPVAEVVTVSIGSAGEARPAGFLVAGVNPRRRLDADYRSFFELAAGHIATALTAARAYEAERRRAEALAEIDRAKTAFFSNVSHEFRTPLTLMLGPLEELLGGVHGTLPPTQREPLDVAHRNSLRLLKLVNSLLDFSRIEAGRIQARYAPVDLAALTADLASNFRSLTERAGLTLAIACPPLPTPVHVDRDMWEKIVLNLLSNAFKFTHEGGITVSLAAEDGHAVLRVRDTGIGIGEAELPRIFERFHRVADARARTHEGTGIGLALVQELVRLHGGTVEVASRLGEGTEFTVRLPFGSGHLPAEQVGPALPVGTGTRVEAYVEEARRWLPEAGTPPVPSLPQAPVDGARPRLLLADDNADMREYVQRLLATRYEVEAVADGQAALEAARRRPPELVLSDVMMPRLDGMGLLAALRADPALGSIPVVLLSARAGEEAQVEGLEAGADDYLVKPFSARELLARVHTHLAMARWRRQNEARLKLMVDELNHRVKNTLATVQSIATQVLHGTPVHLDAREAIETRLMALSRSHNLLTRERWEAAALADVARQALEPFLRRDGAVRFAIEGEPVRLPPKQALALGMAFHELATNAAKYGALSNDSGQVRLAWAVGGGRLQLHWQERGGPAVRPPARRGFGSRLIERGLAHELDGRVRLEYACDGVVCEIDMPLPGIEPPPARDPHIR
ncbi:ATP-binding protein [Fulvimonas yonginensis]|uniref:histidine kinase n=1 Tax=Fulvimonas yonginensis TaxID=1495200 RepID=A0ABU8J6N5_9GAMM